MKRDEKMSPSDLEKHVANDDKLELGPVKRRKSHTNFLKAYLIDYTANSNLHGLKYIGEKERTPVEKIFWLCMFICCVVLCAGLIMKVYKKWNESPVIVSFSENPTPVWEIPYPAVTICAETKAMQTKFNFTNYYHLYLNETTRANLTDEERHHFEDVSLVCDDHMAPPSGRNFSLGNITVSNLKKFSPTLEDLFDVCTWRGVEQASCADMFSSILTEEGICYTFNTLSPDNLFRIKNMQKEYDFYEYLNGTKDQNWNLENGYGEDTSLNTYPHRGLGYGATAGLSFFLRTKAINLDYLCRGPVQGFKVLLHNPAELPRLSQQYFRAPLSQEMVVAVRPKMMVTSEGLKPYKPDVRKCYFPDERYLRYFKVYTQANCEMECLTNFTYARCNCVHFGMPHGPNMKICNAAKVLCVAKARMELVTADVQAGLEEAGVVNNTLGEALEVAKRCRCLAACTSIEYEAETSQADFDWKTLYRAYKMEIDEDEDDLKFARVMIFFKEAQFITSRRSELYGQTDFLANCGGLLGLFMGFSVLSVTEIVYFLTLRVCCLLWRKRRNKKQDIQDCNSPRKAKEAYID